MIKKIKNNIETILLGSMLFMMLTTFLMTTLNQKAFNISFFILIIITLLFVRIDLKNKSKLN